MGKVLKGFLYGALGWALLGPIGAIIGVVIAANTGKTEESKQIKGTGGQSASSGAGYRSKYDPQAQRNSFLISLLVLSTAVMKADGRVLRSELNYVKAFIRNSFGESAVEDSLKIIKELLNKDFNTDEICAQIKICMVSSQRLQLYHYLVGIARADGYVSKEEKSLLLRMAQCLGIGSADANSILEMYAPKSDPYKVLEIDSKATDEEVKKAYKKMAMKFHPDHVETLGEDVRRAAEEKFKNIQEAYEEIKKERNL